MQKVDFNISTSNYNEGFFLKKIYVKKGKIAKYDKFFKFEFKDRPELKIKIKFDLKDTQNKLIEEAEIVELNMKEGDNIPVGTTITLAKLKYCKHSIVFEEFCTTCNKFIQSIDKNKMVQILQNNHKVLVTHEVAKDHEKKDLTRLYTQKKLALVLDLDKTLIHAGEYHTFIKNNPQYISMVEEAKDVVTDWYTIDVGREKLFIKLRPHLEEFLEKASKIFELHVYTHGTRNYAEKIIKLIDKNKKYFHHRVTTANENFLGQKKLSSTKTLKKIFPYSDHMILVLDDNQNVWPDCGNLIRIYPFTFWREDNKEFTQQVTLDKIMIRKSLEDIDLLNIYEMLEKMHKTFYSSLEPLKENIIFKFEEERLQFFKGMKFVFSSLVDKNKPNEKSVFWNLSRLFGADCAVEVDEVGVTHVISQNKDTVKTQQANKLNQQGKSLFILNPYWFFDSIIHWKKVPEDNYVMADNHPMLSERDFSHLREVSMFYSKVESTNRLFKLNNAVEESQNSESEEKDEIGDDDDEGDFEFEFFQNENNVNNGENHKINTIIENHGENNLVNTIVTNDKLIENGDVFDFEDDVEDDDEEDDLDFLNEIENAFVDEGNDPPKENLLVDVQFEPKEFSVQIKESRKIDFLTSPVKESPHKRPNTNDLSINNNKLDGERKNSSLFADIVSPTNLDKY